MCEHPKEKMGIRAEMIEQKRKFCNSRVFTMNAQFKQNNYSYCNYLFRIHDRYGLQITYFKCTYRQHSINFTPLLNHPKQCNLFGVNSVGNHIT